MPHIITNFLLKFGPIHGAFFSSPIWDIILSGNLCESPLYPTPVQGYIPLLTLLLEPHHVDQYEEPLASVYEADDIFE